MIHASKDHDMGRDPSSHMSLVHLPLDPSGLHDSDLGLVNDPAVEWNADLLQKESCIFVTAGCGMNSDVQTLEDMH